MELSPNQRNQTTCVTHMSMQVGVLRVHRPNANNLPETFVAQSCQTMLRKNAYCIVATLSLKQI